VAAPADFVVGTHVGILGTRNNLRLGVHARRLKQSMEPSAGDGEMGKGTHIRPDERRGHATIPTGLVGAVEEQLLKPDRKIRGFPPPPPEPNRAPRDTRGKGFLSWLPESRPLLAFQRSRRQIACYSAHVPPANFLLDCKFLGKNPAGVRVIDIYRKIRAPPPRVCASLKMCGQRRVAEFNYGGSGLSSVPGEGKSFANLARRSTGGRHVF